KLKAVDDEGLESDFSDPASGTTITLGEAADYTWLYALIALILILVIVFAIVASRKKPAAEEEPFERISEEEIEGEEVEDAEEAAEGT
ncbi:MAG: hypothetical protein ACE5IJ_07945, partial [Thermoplasmata archaeon]